MRIRAVASALAWALAAASMIALAQGAAADDRKGRDDDDRARAPARERVKDKGHKYEYSYKDRRCEYKYKYDYRSRETEIRHKGDCRHIAPPFARAADFPMPRTVPPVATPTTIGRCDREQLGQILGGIAGGVIGSQVGEGSRHRSIATVSGIIIGIVVGGEIGRRMDEQDHACMSQALEFAQNDQPVQWTSRDGATYRVTPGAPSASGETICRAFETRLRVDGREQSERGRACRQADGTWVNT